MQVSLKHKIGSKRLTKYLIPSSLYCSELRRSSGLDVGACGKPHAYSSVHVIGPVSACVLHREHANAAQPTDAGPKHYSLIHVPQHLDAPFAAAPPRHRPDHDPDWALHPKPAHDADAGAPPRSQLARSGDLRGGSADAHNAGRQLRDCRQTPYHLVGGADCSEHAARRHSSRAGQAAGTFSSRQRRSSFGGSQCKTLCQNKVPGIVSKQNNS